jgi:hypothetical protein
MGARDVIAKMVKEGSLSLDQVHCIEQRVEKVANVQLAPEMLAAVEHAARSVGTASKGGGGMQLAKALTGPDAFKTIAALVLGGGALTAGGIGAAMAGSAGVHGVDAMVQAVRKGGQYKRMMDANPELAHYDPNELQSAFATLHKFNPELAGDPLVAGTFVRRVADADAIDHRTVGELANTRKVMGLPYGQQAASGQAFSTAMGMVGK